MSAAWCIRMYYEDTVTMKTCFQILGQKRMFTDKTSVFDLENRKWMVE
jgi:hypothetical protein